MGRLIGLAVFTFCLTAILVPVQLAARDDGRFANSPLKPWFDRLASGKGLCCSFADGFSVAKMDFRYPRFVKNDPLCHRRHASKRISQPG
jgi:hypothetical protein